MSRVSSLPFSAASRACSVGALARAIFAASALSTALSIRLTKKLATLATRHLAGTRTDRVGPKTTVALGLLLSAFAFLRYFDLFMQRGGG